MGKEPEIKLPPDPKKCFAFLVSRCASGLREELTSDGYSDVEARNAIIHMLLDFAAGEACRVARGEARNPDPKKWRAATKGAFERAVKRTAPQ